MMHTRINPVRIQKVAETGKQANAGIDFLLLVILVVVLKIINPLSSMGLPSHLGCVWIWREKTKNFLYAFRSLILLWVYL